MPKLTIELNDTQWQQLGSQAAQQGMDVQRLASQLLGDKIGEIQAQHGDASGQAEQASDVDERLARLEALAGYNLYASWTALQLHQLIGRHQVGNRQGQAMFQKSYNVAARQLGELGVRLKPLHETIDVIPGN